MKCDVHFISHNTTISRPVSLRQRILPSLQLPLSHSQWTRESPSSCSIVRRFHAASTDSYRAVDGPSGCARSCGWELRVFVRVLLRYVAGFTVTLRLCPVLLRVKGRSTQEAVYRTFERLLNGKFYNLLFVLYPCEQCSRRNIQIFHQQELQQYKKYKHLYLLMLDVG